MSETNINFKTLWKPLLVAAALAFLFANVLVKLGGDWWTDENYSHGLLVPFVIGFIIWSEFDLLKKSLETPRVWFGFAIVLFALFLLLAGTLGAELFIQRISLVVILTGVVVYFFGAKILQLLVVPFALLLFSIPIPQIVFNKIAFPLQIYASQIAVWGIRLFAIPTVRKGNVFEILPQGATSVIALEVVEACSGIRSLMTLVSLALILAYFTREKNHNPDNGWKIYFKSFDFWRTIILMLSAIPIAVLTNSFRVTMTGVATYYYGKKALTDFWHDLSGWLVYLAALILLLGINSLLRYLSTKFKTQNSKLKISKLSTQHSARCSHSAFGIFSRCYSARRRCLYQLVRAARRSGNRAKTFDRIFKKPRRMDAARRRDPFFRGDRIRFADDRLHDARIYFFRRSHRQFVYRLLRFTAHGRDLS